MRMRILIPISSSEETALLADVPCAPISTGILVVSSRWLKSDISQISSHFFDNDTSINGNCKIYDFTLYILSFIAISDLLPLALSGFNEENIQNLVILISYHITHLVHVHIHFRLFRSHIIGQRPLLLTGLYLYLYSFCTFVQKATILHSLKR